METTDTQMDSCNKLEVFIDNLTFNDGTCLKLKKNSIVVFTGANNSGKSQALKDISTWFKSGGQTPLKVLSEVSDVFLGIPKVCLNDYFSVDSEGLLNSIETYGHRYRVQDFEYWWETKKLYNDLHKIFIKRIDTEQRLSTSNAAQRKINSIHPIFKIFKSQEIAQKLSRYFNKSFSVDLVVNRNETVDIPLHVGHAPNQKNYTIDQQDDYYAEVAKLPKLDEQGDGMRSFASILLDTFTSRQTITLIDEPEAFLHPPQARLLGSMLAKNNPDGRQLFISTHSGDILHGLIDADSENVTVVRINRKENVNYMSILHSEDIKKLWSNPILRYSNILSGLFHDKVIVCESDYDCLFYQSLMNAMYEAKDEVVPDMLFVHCGGKGRMKDIVRALKALNVAVVAVPDFDIIDNSGEFRPLVESFGIKWESDMAPHMKDIYDWLNSDQNRKDNIKRQGKSVFDGIAAEAYRIVESVCRTNGLFLVPCGEMECFHKNTYSKADWVYHELSNTNLAESSELRDAREFVQAIIDFHPPLRT